MRYALRLGLHLALSLCLALSAFADPATQPASTRPAHRTGLSVRPQPAGQIVIEGTLEASMDYPRVEVQLRDGDKTLTAEPTGSGGFGQISDITDLDKLLDGKTDKAARDTTFSAFLDTGASASVLSKSTAARFGVEETPGAVYHEAGLHGETSMGVSKPYELSIRGAAEPDAPLHLVEKQTRIQLSTVEANPLVEMAMGEVNVIGMPAIQKFMVEIKTGGSGTATATPEEIQNLDISDLSKPEVIAKLSSADSSPLVKLHEPSFKTGPVDVTVPLEYVCFSRRHNPGDKGPLPELADNPTVKGVRAELGGKAFTGNWLLDTGAPATIISTKAAQALGLFNDKGEPVRDPDFSLPMGGIGGKVESVPGFRISRLIIPAAGGKSLEYRRVCVFVNDVSTTLDSGETVILDGILGTSLWFPTVAGIDSGFPTDAAPSAFEMVWIDGPGKRLMFKFQLAK